MSLGNINTTQSVLTPQELSQQTGKPVVHYVDGSQDWVTVGKSVLLWPLNHTSSFVSNGAFARTSVVLKKYNYGVFETRNSIYVPESYPYA